jgi:hypothetical protein
MNIVLDDVGRPRSSGGPVNVWQPVLVSSEPGVALSIRSRNQHRVVIFESPATGRAVSALRAQAVRRCAEGTTEEAAEALLGRSGGRSLCTGVAVADLRSGGRVDLCVMGGPPAVLLSPEARAVSVSGPGADAVTCSLAVGDVLLLCSASFLEEPPRVMRTLRDDAPGPLGLRRLRQTLRTVPEAGAVATLAWTSAVRLPLGSVSDHPVSA